MGVSRLVKGEREDEGESEGGRYERKGEGKVREGLITIFFLAPRTESMTRLPSGHFAILVWSCAELNREISSACVCVCACERESIREVSYFQVEFPNIELLSINSDCSNFSLKTSLSFPSAPCLSSSVC